MTLVGRSGHKIVQYFKAMLPTAIFLDISFPVDIETSIRRQLSVIESLLIADRNISTDSSGLSISLCIIFEGCIFSANIGNCRSIIARQNSSSSLVPVQLTNDHVPNVEAECTRILSKGGRIFPVVYDSGQRGKHRVWLSHIDLPGLTITRSIGDTIATTVGVISNPEFTIHHIENATRYLIVATDGIWDMMTNKEIIDILSSMMNLPQAANIIVSESYTRWLDREQVADDIALCIVKF